MGRDPDVLSPFRDPNPAHFPMAGRLAYDRWRGIRWYPIMGMMRGDDGRRMAILK
jgi:hypothetical protein